MIKKFVVMALLFFSCTMLGSCGQTQGEYTQNTSQQSQAVSAYDTYSQTEKKESETITETSSQSENEKSTNYVQETTVYEKEIDLLTMTAISGSEGKIDFGFSDGRSSKDNYGNDGYAHQLHNSYNWYTEDDEFEPLAYYLEGKYSKCSFTLALSDISKNNDYNSWLEFYDQDNNLIFKTDKFTKGVKPMSYDFSVKDVDVLSVDFKMDTKNFMDVSFLYLSELSLK